VLPLQEKILSICSQGNIARNEEKSLLPENTKKSILESFLNFQKSLRKLKYNGDSELEEEKEKEEEEAKITELDKKSKIIKSNLPDKTKQISDEKRKVESNVENEEEDNEVEESSVASPAVQLILDILKR
jgi:hypothetical protein